VLSPTASTSATSGHKGVADLGEHAAIVGQRAWDKVRTILAENAHRRTSGTRAGTPALLKA
jgi:site-specific DNA recombinase